MKATAEISNARGSKASIAEWWRAALERLGPEETSR
jgi:hypothetical protein